MWTAPAIILHVFLFNLGDQCRDIAIEKSINMTHKIQNEFHDKEILNEM